MPDQYKFKAVTQSGERRRGEISAVSSDQVEEYLREHQLLPVKIIAPKQSGPISLFGFMRDGDYEDLIMFTNSLSTMHRAGIPLLRALSMIRVGKPNGRFSRVIEQIRSRIQAGKSISDAMREHRDRFSKVYTASVSAGEESGRLEDTLDELSAMLEQELELNRQIKSAVRYPVIVILAIIAAFFVVMNFVIPRFIGFYSSFDAELPVATRILTGISEFVTTFWPLILVAVFSLVFGFKRLISNPKGRFWVDRQVLKIPVLGGLIIKGNVARFCLMFRILFKSGLPLVQALSILSDTVKNVAIGVEIARLEDFLRRGQDASSLVGKLRYFPDQALYMIIVGLESGALEKMLGEVGDYYSKQVMYTSRQLTAIIEPMLTLIIGGFVLLLALGIFLPMWSLIKVFNG